MRGVEVHNGDVTWASATPSRPGWLPLDADWRSLFDALTPDAAWFDRQWELAGGHSAPKERSAWEGYLDWATTELVR